LLMDIGAEAFTVDRAVEDAWRGEFVAAQGAQEGQGSPMAMRGKAAQALSPWPPAAKRGHVGLDPRLVDEDQTRRIEAPLPRSPAPTPPRDVGPRLLKSEQRFF
jgi:hypothetical protein